MNRAPPVVSNPAPPLAGMPFRAQMPRMPVHPGHSGLAPLRQVWSESLDESLVCRGLVTLRPSFGGCLICRGDCDIQGLMPTIALVDDDRNILTSVSIALEAE